MIVTGLSTQSQSNCKQSIIVCVNKIFKSKICNGVNYCSRTGFINRGARNSETFCTMDFRWLHSILCYTGTRWYYYNLYQLEVTLQNC